MFIAISFPLKRHSYANFVKLKHWFYYKEAHQRCRI